MNYRDLFELGANRRSAIRTKAQKEADTRWSQSVMSRPDTGPGWVPEYVMEPGLEAPMFSPDDLIGTGIPTKLAMLAKAGLGGLAGVAGMGAVKAAGGSTLSDVVRGSARKVAVGQEGGGFLDTSGMLQEGRKIKGLPSMLSLRSAMAEADAAIEAAKSGGPAIVNRKNEPLRFFPKTESPYIQGVPQSLPARAEPRMKGGMPQYNARTVDLLNDPRATEAIRRNIQRGQQMGMQEWYGTAPLREAAAAEGLSEPEFNRMMLHLASASHRSPVEGQIKRGSMTWFADRQGLLAPDAPEFTFPKGYGSLAQKQIIENAKNFAAGGTLDDSKKLGRFHQNLMGNLDPVTVDVMALRGPTMATRDPRWLATEVRVERPSGEIVIERPRDLYQSGQISIDDALNRPGFWEAAPKGPEYGAIEDLYRRVANQIGIAPAEAQATAWYGSGTEAGLRSRPRTFMQALEDRIAFTADQRGETPLQTLGMFIRGEKPLMAIGGGGLIGYDRLMEE